jgi:WD40 repeat protein
MSTLSVPGALHAAWDPTGAMIAVGTRNGGVHRWDVRRASLVEAERPHRDAVVHVAWSSTAGGDVLASASKDGTVGLRDPRPGGARRVLTAHRDHVIAVAFDPTATFFASKSRDGTVRLWRVGPWHVVAAIHEPTAEVGWSVGLAFHPGGRLLATLGDHDRIVRVWDLDRAALPHGALDARELAALGRRSTAPVMAAARHRVRLR